MARNYLQEAIDKIEESEGDVTVNYQEFLLRTAQIFLQISIAQSLENIAQELHTLNQTDEGDKDYKNAIRKLYGK